MIRRIEEISMNAWPALQTYLYDGWVLRFADGYTRRSNSVNPLYSSTIDIHKKIARCEELFSGRNLNIAFKITEESIPENVDKVLEDKGFKREAETSVQVLYPDAGILKTVQNVICVSNLTPEWLSAFSLLSNLSPKQADILGKMLRNLTGTPCCAVLKNRNEVNACGLGVLTGKTAGLFDIVVAEADRGKGYGTELLNGILAWAVKQKAEEIYLQVMTDNKAAETLYNKIGFREAYRYWYRVKKL